MKNYRLINNISGWVVFLVAAVTYLLTIEPTTSLWDCGEFIASGFKLEVGHPPGNPVFMVLARFFTLFAGGDVTRVAAMVNAMSALASAFTILFLFWTITHLARKVIIKAEEQFTTGRIIAIIAAGTVGAVAFTFSDSFWFSAVEGEVYATSSLFTAVVFWAILKWEDVADEKYADRWLILISFLMGLSIGVHLLNLLALPAIVLVYYFRKFRFTWKGFLISIAVSFVFLALLLFGIIPGLVTISMKLDIFFANSLGLPPNSGMVFHVVVLAVMMFLAIKFSYQSRNEVKIALVAVAALFLAGIWVVSDSAILNILVLASIAAFTWYLGSRNRAVLNTVLTSVAVILIGYSANAIIVIRSNANPPLNENNPSNPVNLLYFINREQYGSRPLFKGHFYNAPIIEYKNGKPKYSIEDGKYVVTAHDLVSEHDPRFITFFPRMYSKQEGHSEVYEMWGKVKGTPVQVTNQEGGKEVLRRPTFAENLRFMFSYQVGYMYFRYFMWNFSGRQNDTQGSGGAVNGNWITGINFLDTPRVGTADMPEDMKNDPSRNVYYLLPFLLGIAGFVWHLNRDRFNWFNILLLFLMTGLAIVFYLNQSPNQPRERDYAYTGSFYFFSVWIGLGVMWLYELLSGKLGEKVAATMAGTVCFAAVPLVMGVQNWDDHDRSGRYLARDVAANYLNSCAPGAILFTNGDNDTFPLWYAQEVEGIRTDVRVANLMLLNTDWYIDQMKRRTYESAALPVTIPAKKYYDGVNNQLFIIEKVKDPVDITTIIEYVVSDNRATKVQVSATEMIDIIPARTIRIPVDAKKVIESGTVKPEDADKIVPYIDIQLRGSSILKSQLVVLDILAHNNWERPIYFVTGFVEDALGLEEYFQLEGLAYRLIPIRTENKGWTEYARIDPDILYENMIRKFKWGGANDESVFIDYNHSRTISVVRGRLNYARLGKALAAQGKNELAVEALDFCMNALPLDNVPYDPYVPDLIEAYFAAGDSAKAAAMTRDLASHYYPRIEYYLAQDDYILSSAEFEMRTSMSSLSQAADACNRYGEKELGAEIMAKFDGYYREYIVRMQAGK
jgi:MFS family permease